MLFIFKEILYQFKQDRGQGEQCDEVRNCHQSVKGIRDIPGQRGGHQRAGHNQQYEENLICLLRFFAAQIFHRLGAVLGPPQHGGEGEQQNGDSHKHLAGLAKDVAEGGGYQGGIGQAVGRIAKAFGMDVLAYSRTEYPQGRLIARYVTLPELLAQSDIISLHCPLTPETMGIINRETISIMKDGAILINTSRGAAIVEQDLADALQNGKLRAAAVDVVTTEPIPATSPLLTALNCIITPHMAWAPKESRQRIMDCTKRSIEAYLSGNPINTVN